MTCALWMKIGGEKEGERFVGFSHLGKLLRIQEIFTCGIILSNLKLFAVYCELFMCINTLEGAMLFTKCMIPCHYTTS